MKGFVTMGFVAVLAACTPPAPPATGPAPDPSAPGGTQTPAGPSREALEATAAELRRSTAPASPRQANFGWSLDEAGARFSGRGVARYVAPRRVRLDLFGPRGETYLAAALVDGELRAPPALLERFELPSPALLWGAVGVVAPPADAALLDATTRGDDTTLRYRLGDDVLEYRVSGGRLQTVRRLGRGGGVAESIDLTYNQGAQTRAQYRDWAAFRTLILTIESSRDVEQFPEETWRPAGT